ncbi:palmitoyltransferase ZDHHC12-like isoform X2 [Narcine bancroftii]
MTWDLIYGAQKQSRIAIFTYFLMIVGWGYPVYIFMAISMDWKELWSYHLIFILCNLAMWFYYLDASLSDPGNLARYTEQYNQVMRQIIKNKQDSGQLSAKNLCHACQLVRPLRSNHCPATKRCVAHFDHYCSVIYNAVGYKNRSVFFIFLVLLALNCWMATFLGAAWLQRFGFHLPMMFAFLVLLASTLVVSLRACFTLALAMLNLTAYEVQHCHELDYLQRRGGRIKNPFHQDMKLSLLEFFHFIDPLSDREIKEHLQHHLV